MEVDSDSKGFRLPTSMEWELAARYINGKRWTPGNYASGAIDDIDNTSATGAVAWYEVNSGSSTHPVGQKKPFALRLPPHASCLMPFAFRLPPKQTAE